MRTLVTAGAVLTVLVGIWAAGTFVAVAQVDGNDNNIAVMDDCLPGDAGWDPIGTPVSCK